ncbi:MAG: hypothetical protein NXI24_24210 [bacterium]|nr:hypothetical protein [bacterium]
MKFFDDNKTSDWYAVFSILMMLIAILAVSFQEIGKGGFYIVGEGAVKIGYLYFFVSVFLAIQSFRIRRKEPRSETEPIIRPAGMLKATASMIPAELEDTRFVCQNSMRGYFKVDAQDVFDLIESMRRGKNDFLHFYDNFLKTSLLLRKREQRIESIFFINDQKYVLNNLNTGVDVQRLAEDFLDHQEKFLIENYDWQVKEIQ